MYILNVYKNENNNNSPHRPTPLFYRGLFLSLALGPSRFEKIKDFLGKFKKDAARVEKRSQGLKNMKKACSWLF